MKAKRKPATKAKAATAKRAQKAPGRHAPTPEFYGKLGRAYRDQESDIGDLLIMAEITSRASIGNEKGEAIFTAHHLRDMIEDFRKHWYAAHKDAESEAA